MRDSVFVKGFIYWVKMIFLLGLGTHLFVKVPWPGDSEGTFSVFESSCHLYYQSNHSKVEAILLSALPKDSTSELAGLSPHPLHINPLNAERQVGKLW